MRSRSFLPVILILLVALAIASCGTGFPKPRANAVGLRFGGALPSAEFTDQSVGRTVIETNNQVNFVPKVRQPLAFQFGEPGAGHFFSVPYFDISRITAYDIPPSLNGLDNQTYEDLSLDNPNTFTIKRSQTFTDRFVNNHPQYEDRINKLSEPSLSADIDVVSYSYGQIFGFYFSGTRIRWFTTAVGLGISYSYGVYKVNVCDPYTVMGPSQSDFPVLSSSIVSRLADDGEAAIADSREGVCLKKSNLFSKHLSNFGFGWTAVFKFYSYVGDTFEFNLLESDFYGNIPTFLGGGADTILKPKYTTQYINLMSLYYRL
ncbi:MAG: hypothetical protein P8O70_17665 [SAR324 cluster bacterium]|nr:hypothetical protein [SAR324 cluster bacterium]